MEIRQAKSNVRGKYRPYSADDLSDAYRAVIEQGLPVERVAKIYGVPITTLKDRVKGRINVDCVKSGPETMFSQEQEAFLAKHLTTMAEIGYGYSRQETINLASDYAVHLGLRNKTKPLSITWLYSFLDRWPELKVKKPQSLEIARAKSATRPTIARYFQELDRALSICWFSWKCIRARVVKHRDIHLIYMTEHLELLLPSHTKDTPVIVLYDGHKSHVSLGLIEWARSQHIILFVLPPHCSYLLQPMDVSCFGPFEIGWNAACHQYLRESGGPVVTRYDVARIASKVYTTTLTPVNIQSAFKRCGLYPFNPDVVSDIAIPPSLGFLPQTTNETGPVIETGSIAAECQMNVAAAIQDGEPDARMFLEKRGGEVMQNVAVAKARKTLSKVVAGKAITEDTVYDAVKKHISEQKRPKTKTKGVNKAVPSTSGVSNKKKPTPHVVSDSDCDESSMPESEKCVICKCHSVKDLDKLPFLTIVNWGCCDKCDGWVHLRFCSPVRALRRNDTFICPLCTSEQ